jgi:hypothetical protein
MNRNPQIGSKSVWIVIVAVMCWLSSDLPLQASPPQSPPATSLPDAPQPQSAQTSQQSAQAPSGAAGAKAPPVHGAPAAQPVGAAVAPARQRGHRSLLIKAGLLAGAGIAVGTVIALSERSPNRPPGSPSSTHP